MKKKVFILFAILLFIIFPIYWTQKRNFYYLPEIDTYVTVWKKLGGVCYIIIGDRYFSFTEPNKNIDFIRTTNADILTILYSSDNKKYLNIETNNKSIIVNQDKYVMKIFRIEEMKAFSQQFYHPRDRTKPALIKAPYKDMIINTKENLVYLNDSVVKYGNILGR